MTTGILGAIQSPAAQGQAFSSSSEVTLDRATRGVYIGADGNLVVKLTKTSEDLAFNNVKAGTVLQLVVEVVRSDTTCSGILLF